MGRADRRARESAFRAEQARQPIVLRMVPREMWPVAPAGLVEVWRSRRFLVQVYAASEGAERVSVNRVVIAGDRWADGITWDDLQSVKREIGRGERWAVEVFPADSAVVNVANMRHLWLLPERPAYAWDRGATR